MPLFHELKCANLNPLIIMKQYKEPIETLFTLSGSGVSIRAVNPLLSFPPSKIVTLQYNLIVIKYHSLCYYLAERILGNIKNNPE